MENKAGMSYNNTSLNRVVNIMICLSNGLNTSTAIANQCNYSVSTVHRLLNVMKGLNLTIQDTYNHKYYLGPLLSQILSNQTAAHLYLIISASQEMDRLSDLTEETINLSILDYFHYTLLRNVPSKHELTIIESNRSHNMFFAAGATWKVLLSQLGDMEIREFLVNISETGKNGVNNKDLLLKQVKEIKRKKYAISYGERIPGSMCFSAPISNYKVPVALSVLGPEIRLKNKKSEILNELEKSAKSVSEIIGRSMPKQGNMAPIDK